MIVSSASLTPLVELMTVHIFAPLNSIETDEFTPAFICARSLHSAILCLNSGGAETRQALAAPLVKLSTLIARFISSIDVTNLPVSSALRLHVALKVLFAILQFKSDSEGLMQILTHIIHKLSSRTSCAERRHCSVAHCPTSASELSGELFNSLHVEPAQ